jgi:RNA polymerase sigma factor (sigma-70 family)
MYEKSANTTPTGATNPVAASANHSPPKPPRFNSKPTRRISPTLDHTGWRERRQREADSRHVRVIDFERALSKLDPMHQQVLVLTYRDGIRHREAAHMLGCSERLVYYLLPAARRRLNDILDRLDLL